MKQKFNIEIEETLQHVYEIEANSLEEAISIAHDRYRNEEYILDENDYKGTEFREYKEEPLKQKPKRVQER